MSASGILMRFRNLKNSRVVRLFYSLLQVSAVDRRLQLAQFKT